MVTWVLYCPKPNRRAKRRTMQDALLEIIGYRIFKGITRWLSSLSSRTCGTWYKKCCSSWMRACKTKTAALRSYPGIQTDSPYGHAGMCDQTKSSCLASASIGHGKPGASLGARLGVTPDDVNVNRHMKRN